MTEEKMRARHIYPIRSKLFLIAGLEEQLISTSEFLGHPILLQVRDTFIRVRCIAVGSVGLAGGGGFRALRLAAEQDGEEAFEELSLRLEQAANHPLPLQSDIDMYLTLA